MSIRQSLLLLLLIFAPALVPAAISGSIQSQDTTLSVSGKLLLENDAPVAAFPMEYYGPTSGAMTTGDDGSFQFDAKPGDYTIHLDSGAAVARQIFNPGGRFVHVVAGQPITNFIFRVQAASVLVHGTLKDSNGTAVPNVGVLFQQDWNISAAAYTDINGEYSVRLFPGTWTGTVDQWTLNNLGLLTPVPATFDFQAGEYTANFVVERATIPVSGILKDDHGAILTNLLVSATSGQYSGTYNSFSGETDATGRFNLTLSVRTWRIGLDSYSLPPQGGLYPITYDISVSNSPLITNLIIPRITSRLGGVVRSAAGANLSNVYVSIESTFNGVRIPQFAETDSNGSFAVSVPNGAWKVQPNDYRLNSLGLAGVPAQTVTLNDQTNETLVFIASPPPKTIRGRIADESGAGVSNLVVRAYSRLGEFFSATSDAQGNYVIPADTGDWQVYLDTEPLASCRYLNVTPNVTINIPESSESAAFNISLVRAPYTIRVRVFDENGSPVAPTGSPVSLSASAVAIRNTRAVSSYGSIVGDVAEIPVCAGKWSVNVSLPYEFRPPGSKTVTVTNSEVEVTFTADRWVIDSVIAGQVLDENDKPLTNIAITASGPYYGTPRKTVNSEGRVNYSVPSGNWMLLADGANYLFTRPYFFVPAGVTTNKVIRARRTDSVVTIHLNHPGVDDLECFSVDASIVLGGDYFSVTKTVDSVSVIQLPLFPGEWTLRFRSCYGIVRPIADQQINITGPTAELTLDLQSAAPTAFIRGKVVNSSGAAVERPNVWAGTSASFNKSVTGQEDGRFTLGIYGTNWEVMIFIPGGPNLSRVTRVKDGQDQDWGTITIPDASAEFHVVLVDTNDVPLTNVSYFQASARQYGTSLDLISSDFGYDNSRTIRLSPGLWEITLDIGQADVSELAGVPPFSVDIPTGVTERRVQVRPKPAIPAPPRLNSLPILNGIPRLQLRYDASMYVEIQTSDDLVNWTRHSVQYTGFGYPYVFFFEAAENQARYFRANVLP